MTNIVALVTARGGSKGIPGKNVASVGGKPLIAWSIEAALGSSRVQRTLVSTDDPQIAEVSRNAGAEVPFLRPPELARDNSSHLSVVLHTLDWLADNDDCHPDYLLLLQPTSPLRTSADIDAAVDLAEKHDADSVVSVCAAHNHPYLVKQVTSAGVLADFLSVDRKAYLRRQDLPGAYALNGALYIIRPSVLRQQQTFLPERTFPYVMPAERSLDIDDPWDLHLVRLVMEDQACRSRTSTSATVPLATALPASSLRKPA
jgi:CMP-N,N'-diacetyllegionaminic acid synthase